MNQIFLSLIIPAYNEERRLPRTLNRVMEFLETQPFSSEVWVVDNASTDDTPEIIADFSGRYPSLYGLTEGQPGKGAAVRRGMLTARGNTASWPMPISPCRLGK